MFDAGRRFDRLYLVLRQTLGMIAKYLDYSAISNTTAAALRNHSLEFGLERLQRYLGGVDPVNDILASVQEFSGQLEAQDDRTLVVLERTK